MSEADGLTVGAASAAANVTFVVRSKAREISYRYMLQKQTTDKSEPNPESEGWLLSQSQEKPGPDGSLYRPILAFGKIKFMQITRCPRVSANF